MVQGGKKEQARPKIEINVGTVHTLPDEGKRTVQKIAEQSKVNQNQPTGILLKGLE